MDLDDRMDSDDRLGPDDRLDPDDHLDQGGPQEHPPEPVVQRPATSGDWL